MVLLLEPPGPLGAAREHEQFLQGPERALVVVPADTQELIAKNQGFCVRPRPRGELQICRLGYFHRGNTKSGLCFVLAVALCFSQKAIYRRTAGYA